MGIPFTMTMGFLFTATMGNLFTMTLGTQLTISNSRLTIVLRVLTKRPKAFLRESGR